MPHTSHIPERTCVACRKKRPQAQLRRVARAPGGWKLTVGEREGRGAYVCADNPACWAPKRLKRAFGGHAEAVSQALLGEQRELPGSVHSPQPGHTMKSN